MKEERSDQRIETAWDENTVSCDSLDLEVDRKEVKQILISHPDNWEST